MTAQMAMATMSSNWCCLHRSILGSSKAPKYSMMDAPFPFFITPHLTSQTLGLPSNDKPTIYNAIALRHALGFGIIAVTSHNLPVNQEAGRFASDSLVQ